MIRVCVCCCRSGGFPFLSRAARAEGRPAFKLGDRHQCIVIIVRAARLDGLLHPTLFFTILYFYFCFSVDGSRPSDLLYESINFLVDFIAHPGGK
jgi:hypothetical protein